MTQFDLNLYKSFIKTDNNPPQSPVVPTTTAKPTATTVAKIDTEPKNDTLVKTTPVTSPTTPPPSITPTTTTTTSTKNISETQPTKVPDTKADAFKDIKDEFINSKKSRGLFERVYDFGKNITGLGLGYKKLENKITLAEAGKISKEEIKHDIDNYKKSNKNAQQSFGDLFSGLTSLGTFLGISNFCSKLNARYQIGAIKDYTLTEAIRGIEKLRIFSNFEKNVKNLVSSSIKTKAFLAVPVAMFIGGITKYLTLKINRIGSKEFDVGDKKTLGPKKYKELKGIKKSQKRLDSLKNFGTGMLNGLLAPLASLVGGFVGIPAYLIASSGIRYATNNKNKSLSDFGEQLKENAVLNTAVALSMGIPAFSRVKYSKELNENLVKVVKNLKSAYLVKPNYEAKGAMQILETKLLSSPEIDSILNSSMTIEEKILALTNENIFAVKFKQIQRYDDELITMLRENCPPTRSISEAESYIARILGHSDYRITKCLGVGTVAETYLATDKNGKEFAIKILKQGITREKILADKEKFLKLVTNGLPEEKLSQEQIYLKRNIENLAESILKEVDFANEAQAAKQLAKVTQKANVVVPITAKDGVYIMEKANGISIGTLYKYIQAKCRLDRCMKNPDLLADEIVYLKREIEQIKASAPAFEDFTLTKDHLKKIINAYTGVTTEQFTKLNRNGKIIHGDIHPGNIFIDLEVLQGKKKGKLFTLIDTGNTITLTKEQTKDSLRLIAYVKNGNYKDLARMTTETSILPEGMTREQARKYVEDELKKIFTDSKTAIGTMTVDSLFRLTDAIQQQKGIIPVNTQLTLEKSKKSAANSFDNLLESFCQQMSQDLFNASNRISKGFDGVTDLLGMGLNKKRAQTIQETKNLLQMSPKEALEFMRNKNMLPTNGIEHLTYTFKQNMPTANPSNPLLEAFN